MTETKATGAVSDAGASVSPIVHGPLRAPTADLHELEIPRMTKLTCQDRPSDDAPRKAMTRPGQVQRPASHSRFLCSP